ncbi:hypothetical protein LEP1GSC125_1135 [Leptospira mayottensis 200901122]|uniref:Uncharacterized protein n=1 Tax=Leptospira mayottensis 200901122 TaxID=1193010 RepID=A0AA87MPB9_9LEPT|nr:hypothetical protein LEP1GSC125_1135 [Leptospira mayottensis 200901122]
MIIEPLKQVKSKPRFDGSFLKNLFPNFKSFEAYSMYFLFVCVIV